MRPGLPSFIQRRRRRVRTDPPPHRSLTPLSRFKRSRRPYGQGETLTHGPSGLAGSHFVHASGQSGMQAPFVESYWVHGSTGTQVTTTVPVVSTVTTHLVQGSGQTGTH